MSFAELDHLCRRLEALGHAQAMHEQAEAGLDRQEFPQTAGCHKQIVAQTDGGMIPIVEPDAGQKDKRKGRCPTLIWFHATGVRHGLHLIYATILLPSILME